MSTLPQITYRDAINRAMKEEMRRDPSVFVYGIDVADHKGTFGSCLGLAEEFGPERCFSSALCEEGMTGFGMGAAINGLRPIHVHMRVDFLILAMNQLVNMISSSSYGSCGSTKVPMVIRAVIGRGWGQSWQHSKTLFSWFSHVPGLKVIVPARPCDALGMLKAAIRYDGPVLMIEHRWLYDAVGPMESTEPASLSGCHVIRQGKDLSVLAISWMNVEAMKAAEVMQRKHGVSLEVIDVRSLNPFDAETVANSVNHTGRLIVADYDWIHCGFSAEVAAQVYARCVGKLKAPIDRLGFADAHCPCTRPLENAYYASAVDIIRASEKQLGLRPADLSDEEFYSYERKFKGPF
jgi:acetoin:2,6-dichlorophenolindophenol oxidoreductase subunit beta